MNRRLLKAHLSASTAPLNETPRIAILLTVCDPDPLYLQKAIDSVFAQTSSNWQLCIADDASTDPKVAQILDEVARRDARVLLTRRQKRGGISAATNTAFGQSSSPFITCLDHDDLLAPTAIEVCARHLAAHPDCRLLFSDEDKIDEQDERFSPYFKPRRFSRELFYSGNYINHLTLHHADTVRKVGGWRTAYDGAQDYDLSLRVLETIPQTSIDHIPLVLYHWRAIAGSAAVNINFKPYALDAGRRALNDHLDTEGRTGRRFNRCKHVLPGSARNPLAAAQGVDFDSVSKSRRPSETVRQFNSGKINL